LLTLPIRRTMIKGIYDVVTGAIAQEKKLAVIANNLANAQTAGFKAMKLIFEALESDAVVPNESLPTTFVAVFDSFTDFAHAASVETGNRTDVAIQGDGFFAVNTPEGIRYTRNGQFTLDSEKRLVTSDGFPVMGEGGGLNLDGSEIMIESDGSVFVDRVVAGKLKIVDFKDKRSLQPVGRGFFVNTDPANGETAPERYVVRQGAYEASNVEVVKEMVEMMAALRAYESYSKVIQSVNDMYGKLIDVARS
jgi:flagellar basal-body rod protein FlgF